MIQSDEMNSTAENCTSMPPNRDLLEHMGRIISDGNLYGLDHQVTVKSVDLCFNFLSTLLEVVGSIRFKMTEDGQYIDGYDANMTNFLINTLTVRLADMGGGGFSFVRGMTREEFSSFVVIMFTGVRQSDEDGLQQMLNDFGIKHVEPPQTVTRRIITDKEKVVLKDEPGTPSSQGDTIGQSPESKLDIAQITAFLSGEGGGDSSEVSKAIESMLLSDPDRLALLMMEVLSVECKKEGVEDAESLDDILVGCLTRARQALLKDSSTRTKTRTKDLKKQLLLLEEALLRAIHDGTDVEEGSDLATAVSAEIEEISDGLALDEMVTDYMKKSGALAKTEGKLIKHINAAASDPVAQGALRAKLAEQGLSPEELRELEKMARATGSDDAQVQSQTAIDAGSKVMELLTNLNEMIHAEKQPVEVVRDAMAYINDQTEYLASQTAEKIGALGDQINHEQEILKDLPAPERTRFELSRRALRALLAEIVQELCQPATVISCSIEMTIEGHLGAITEPQREVLSCAAECGERLKQLLDKLIEVVGVPKGLIPDVQGINNSGEK
jgi:hypothetical protein